MDGIYFVIRHKTTKEHQRLRGVSGAPHLYLSKGKAEGQRKHLWRSDEYESVPVQLTVLEEKEPQQ
jgi:hypothetical protein